MQVWENYGLGSTSKLSFKIWLADVEEIILAVLIQ